MRALSLWRVRPMFWANFDWTRKWETTPRPCCSRVRATRRRNDAFAARNKRVTEFPEQEGSGVLLPARETFTNAHASTTHNGEQSMKHKLLAE